MLHASLRVIEHLEQRRPNGGSIEDVEVVNEFEWGESTRASTALIEALADARGVHPTEIEPLSESIDIDALNRLCKAEVDAFIQFDVAGYGVLLDASGSGYIYEHW